MISAAHPSSNAAALELAELVERVSTRLKAGEAVNPDELAREHPGHADELVRLLPTIRVMAELSKATRDGPRVPFTDSLDGVEALGDYFLIREIGRGGMGVVYEAKQRSLNRSVALKVLPFAATMDPRYLQRFKHEAQAAAMLHHPHIVPVYGVGCERGVHYYAMQLIEGRSLAAVVEEMKPSPTAKVQEPPIDATADFSPTPSLPHCPTAKTAPVAALSTQSSKSKKDKTYFRTTVERIAQAANALEYAHSMGVVHRDVKPANLLLDNAGHLWVTDFGLAKFDAAAAMTVSGDLIGTLRYMSPEQALARHGLVDHRTDVYSLGATLYELLTLRPVFDGADKHEILRKIAFEEPVTLRKLDRSIPEELETITLKALAKEPEERYASAGEFAKDLGCWLEDRPIRARPAGVVERTVRWSRRHPAAAGLYATLVTVGFAVVAAAFAYEQQQVRQDRARAVIERHTRATALIEALETSDIAVVPVIVRGLEPMASEAEPLLRDRYVASAPGSGLRIRLAISLLQTDPRMVDELLAAVSWAGAGEIQVIRNALRDHTERVTAQWPRLADNEPGIRLRYAALLAGVVPPDNRWQLYIADLADQLVRLDPTDRASWFQLFDPLHQPLSVELLEIYRHSSEVIKSGYVSTTELVALASRFDTCASILSRMAVNEPNVLAELLVIADPRHFSAFLSPAQKNRIEVQPLIVNAIKSKSFDQTAKDAEIEDWASRQANAAVVMMHFGDSSATWLLLRYSTDPTARSYLIHGMAPRGIDPTVLTRRYAIEPDLSVRRAILLALGEYDIQKIPVGERERLAIRLQGEYRNDPDAGLHGAIDWLLRQRWGQAAELDRITAGERGRPIENRNWFVNSQGQTFTVIRGPVSFPFGSPPGEPGRGVGENDPQKPERIEYSFAIGVREVTVAEYRRFNSDFAKERQPSAALDEAASGLNWYQAAAYCRWLSEQEGVPADQMVYPEIKDIKPNMRLPDDYLSRTGYRLPIAMEWECACRAETVTARPYGRGIELLDRYGWYLKNGREHVWPCGLLKPNDWGLFDILGNTLEWCQEASGSIVDPSYHNKVYVVADGNIRRLRGGSFNFTPASLRSTYRGSLSPYLDFWDLGFRPMRTIR